jgi:hypothetical protein
MDERLFRYKTGKPIPEWDAQHRLPINKPIGPERKDTATVFRINSTYMDITDQPYMSRQWQAGGVFIALFGAMGMLYAIAMINFIYPPEQFGAIDVFGNILFVGFLLSFGYAAFRSGRDEFFSLKRRPIRFNREQQKIYTIRRRRFFSKPEEGDIAWEIPWSEESFFCIHKGTGTTGKPYHIRYYALDNNGNVVRAFSIGREWEGKANLEGLLSQWNYWCWYMNHGPADLPKPPLYFSEHENIRESFLFCMYSFGFRASATSRIIMMPAILLMTSFRLLALWTCREAIWPKSIEQVSTIATDDAYNQPRGDTPVGWAETTLAQERHDYPYNPKREMDHWRGEKDGAANAWLWAEDIPPKISSTT